MTAKSMNFAKLGTRERDESASAYRRGTISCFKQFATYSCNMAFRAIKMTFPWTKVNARRGKSRAAPQARVSKASSAVSRLLLVRPLIRIPT